MKGKFTSALAALALAATGVLSAVSVAPVAAAPASGLGAPPAVSSLNASNTKKISTGIHSFKGKPSNKKGASVETKQERVAGSAALVTVSYHYNTMWDNPPLDGAGKYPDASAINMVIPEVNRPYLATGDYHSLGESAVFNPADNGDIAEVGWTADRGVCSATTSKKCLFIYHWINGAETCYNGCNFVEYNGAPNVWDIGDDLTSVFNTNQPTQFVWSGGNLWIAFANEWLGYFPGSEWGGTWTNGFNRVQHFGEIAAGTTKPCTDMGDGDLGTATNTAAARFGSYNTRYPGGAFTATNADSTSVTGPSAPYPSGVWQMNWSNGSLQTTRYGGPGYNSAGTAAGTAGAC